MKLCLPIHVCHYLSNNDPMNLKKIMKIFLISIIPIFFVIIEPDLGTGIILMTIIGGLLFIGGIKKKYIFTASFLFSVAFPIIWSRMYTYQKQRVVTFITGGDLKKEGYQIRQSRIAIGSGRALGKGFMQGTQFRFHFLPKPETDFIFSCICEEWGFIGAMVIMWIFLYLTIVSIATSLWKQVSYENYLCFAIGIYIFFSFFFNIAMTMSLLPTVGVPLPVLSRGGSSTATFLLALALLINIRKINYKNC
jgi:rod shape determining protein RodA